MFPDDVWYIGKKGEVSCFPVRIHITFKGAKRTLVTCFHSNCPSQQVGLSILIISSLIVFILSGIDLKDVLWIAFQADILGVAALMPLIGFMLGYVMSVTCGLNAQ